MRAVAGMEVCALMYYFCWKYIMFEPKRYRGVMCHTLKNDEKFEEEQTCVLKNDMRNLANFNPTLESLKNSL